MPLLDGSEINRRILQIWIIQMSLLIHIFN
jgi:hypothetical protein